jgi:hypothetical protein
MWKGVMLEKLDTFQGDNFGRLCERFPTKSRRQGLKLLDIEVHGPTDGLMLKNSMSILT